MRPRPRFQATWPRVTAREARGTIYEDDGDGEPSPEESGRRGSVDRADTPRPGKLLGGRVDSVD